MQPAEYNLPAGYTPQQEAVLIQGGRAYFDLLLRLIHQATDTIHLQTYIYHHDETGQLIAQALKEAAQRKVAIYVLVDGYASQSLDGHFIQSLRAAGIQFRFFEPLFRSSQFYVGRRMHHKLFVADAKFALVGGVNIANRYNDMEGMHAWLDFALYIAGPMAVDLCVLCSKTWNGYTAQNNVLPCPEAVLPANPAIGKGIAVRMRRNDWVRRKSEISATYIEMFRHAKSHIILMCSYFLPGRAIRRLLRNAVNRGVKIQVVTAGPSDVPVAKWAERWLYDWLLRNKIELYEYQPTVLHAKIALCDGQWFTIGSYNVNNISTYASVELNLDVSDAALATATEKQLQQIIVQNCTPINQAGHRKSTNPFRQFGRWLAYQFIRVVFYLFTFYFKRRAIKRKP
jgi:cardiolipin synthase A/B